MDAEPSTSNRKPKKCDVNNNQRLIAESGGRCMSTQAMQSLYDFRQNNLLCDAVLRLEDGGVFPIHRAILSACSTYFRFNFIRRLSFFPDLELFWRIIYRSDFYLDFISILQSVVHNDAAFAREDRRSSAGCDESDNESLAGIRVSKIHRRES